MIVDTSCDTKGENNLMKSFLASFFDSVYKKESYSHRRIGLVQNDGKDNIVLISPGLSIVRNFFHPRIRIQATI
mgnify:CR=1 FL=1